MPAVVFQEALFYAHQVFSQFCFGKGASVIISDLNAVSLMLNDGGGTCSSIIPQSAQIALLQSSQKYLRGSLCCLQFLSCCLLE